MNIEGVYLNKLKRLGYEINKIYELMGKIADSEYYEQTNKKRDKSASDIAIEIKRVFVDFLHKYENDKPSYLDIMKNIKIA